MYIYIQNRNEDIEIIGGKGCICVRKSVYASRRKMKGK